MSERVEGGASAAKETVNARTSHRSVWCSYSPNRGGLPICIRCVWHGRRHSHVYTEKPIKVVFAMPHTACGWSGPVASIRAWSAAWSFKVIIINHRWRPRNENAKQSSDWPTSKSSARSVPESICSSFHFPKLGAPIGTIGRNLLHGLCQRGVVRNLLNYPYP